MGVTPPTPAPDPGRHRNASRPLVVDGFMTSLLLVLAAAYLPRTSQTSNLSRPELQTALGMAAIFLCARSQRQIQQLSNHAEARFTAYLLATKQAESLACGSCVLHRWLQTNDIDVVTTQLQAAAYAARLMQAAVLFDAYSLQAFVLGRIPEPDQKGTVARNVVAVRA